MKIHGQVKQSEFSTEVTLPRVGGEGVRLKISPLPLGFHRRLQQHGLCAPLPPRRVARDSNQKPIRDERGQAVFVHDEQDSGYREELDLFHQRVAVLIVAEALKGDPHVEFDSKVPAGEDGWTEYADCLYAELEEAQFRAGDLLYLCHEIGKLSNLFDEHVSASQRDFFSGAGTSMKT